MKDIYVVNCCRTAVGTFGGSLRASFTTPPIWAQSW